MKGWTTNNTDDAITNNKVAEVVERILSQGERQVWYHKMTSKGWQDIIIRKYDRTGAEQMVE